MIPPRLLEPADKGVAVYAAIDRPHLFDIASAPSVVHRFISECGPVLEILACLGQIRQWQFRRDGGLIHWQV